MMGYVSEVYIIDRFMTCGLCLVLMLVYGGQWDEVIVVGYSEGGDVIQLT